MNHTSNPETLKWPITPNIIIDDYIADSLSVILSPEIPLSSFSLKQCFQNVSFKNDSKKEWIKVLRDIADDLEKNKIPL